MKKRDLNREGVHRRTKRLATPQGLPKSDLISVKVGVSICWRQLCHTMHVLGQGKINTNCFMLI